MSVGELEGDLDTIWDNGFEFIESQVDDYDAYKELSADKKVKVFEEEDQLSFLYKSYEELFGKLARQKL